MKLEFNDNYDNIINMPHHKSKVHPPMSLEDRAAQFSPFSALSGLEDAIDAKAKEALDTFEDAYTKKKK